MDSIQIYIQVNNCVQKRVCPYNLLTQRACSRSANNHAARNKREIRIGCLPLCLPPLLHLPPLRLQVYVCRSTSTYTSLWTLEETKALIAVWDQANVQSQLDELYSLNLIRRILLSSSSLLLCCTISMYTPRRTSASTKLSIELSIVRKIPRSARQFTYSK